MLSLAALRKEEGDLAAAEPLYTEALALRRSLNGDDDPLTLSAMMALGLLLRAKGAPEDLAQAAVLLTAAEERCRSVLGAQHPGHYRGRPEPRISPPAASGSQGSRRSRES